MVGVAATAVTLVKMLPQVRTVLRREPLTGLAPATFLLTQVSAATWTAYGLATHQPSVVACSAVSVVLAGVVLSRRCPPRAVVRALHHGRWGVPGQLLVRPVVLLAA
nr:PQ-loop repeat-containing protein [Kineococcus siccus]